MKYSIIYDIKTKIVTKTYFGDIYIDDIFETWDEAIEKNQIPNDVSGFLLDYKNANLNVPPLQTSGIAKYYRDHLELFANKKIAILSESSKNIIVPILMQEMDQGYVSKPFSSLEAAINWILS